MVKEPTKFTKIRQLLPAEGREMKAMVLRKVSAVEAAPLVWKSVRSPGPAGARSS
jgi:hypothetical protein